MVSTPTSAIKVAVLGGGVAGMSAAHELAERGFSVDVYERQPEYVGGKARSVNVPNTGKDGRPDLPGEHGFRFFPGFYRHITDTMKRIPYGNNPQGVFDNLVASQRVLLARFGRPPLPALVNFPKTLADLETILQDLAGADTGLTRSDMHLFAHSLWRILTSSYERRQQVYERMSWWQFMQTDEQRHRDGVGPPPVPFPYEIYCVGGLTHSLVAAQPKLMSIKTGGDILLQLLLLTANPEAHTDRVLNGPTNEVWLTPWLKHLTGALGVRYHQHHYITRLTCDPFSRRITAAYMRRDVESVEELIEADYYVAAVPVERMAQLINDDMLAVDATLGFIQTLAAPATQALNWMNGIQYYLNVDVPLTPGHVICLDSPWALTGISQAQFWPQHPLAGYGNGQVKGLISIDVSDWFNKGLNGKTASDCELPEVAKEVWEELKKSLVQADGTSLLTDDMLVRYHIDSDIEPGTEHVVPPPIQSPFAAAHNTEPLLVNTANSWSLRPESFCGIQNLFLASDYVRTNTDLATMEGANEAARRAVNGIIVATGSSAPLCQIWPLHEPDILAVLRWRDRQRFAQGLPWTDVLEGWPTRLLHEANYWWHRLRGVK
ncbi:FAD-dependent oxidoreductase [Hymenobacter sp. HMF4947]|uniref:FAD-dependent oxidoreductase n=1 Tax=Hymenobacter ginkgonis TaxID=2682976 RepID=A0A7K1TI90_9BACT|nr:FAD-dependent oxidoreductase [Hymenobacter ginkgonis]MVN78125.1 FAD-dependent oxidoreductase [Hymenobacter ginkgonis]